MIPGPKEKAALPTLPKYHINLKVAGGEASASALELGRHIREGFARRYS